MLRKKGVVGKFVEFFGPGLDHDDARRPGDDRQHGAGIRRHLRLLPGRRARRSTISTMSGRDPRPRRAGRGLRQGAGPVPRPTDRPTRSSPTRSSSTSPRSCRRSPARSARRTACSLDRRRRPASPPRWRASSRSPASSASACRSKARDFDIGHGDVVIAAITCCTNTSNPSVLIAAGLLARKAVAKGLKSKPWVKTSLAPGSQVVTDYLTRPGCRPTSTSSASTSSASAAPPASATPGPLPDRSPKPINDERPRRRGRAVRQPQLRRPRQPRRAGELPRLAAAGRRLRAGRLDAGRSGQRAARHGQATASRST